MAHALVQREPAQLDADHEAPGADLGDRRKRREVALEEVLQQCDLRLQTLERALLLEHVEAGQAGGAAERIAGERVTVEKGLELLEAAEERFVDPLGRERRGQR